MAPDPTIPPNKEEIETQTNAQATKRLCCNICSKYFTHQRSLEAHQRRHEGLPGYPCTHENCVSTFDHFHDLQKHLNEHDGIACSVYKCEDVNCTKLFYGKVSLKVHMKKFHKCPAGPLIYECETCGETFDGAQNLLKHSYVHKDKSTWLYTCNVEGCIQKFRNMTHLREHKNRHAGIKKFTCPHCGVGKTTAQDLRYHINIHTMERTWPCEHCTKVFRTLGTFKAHIKNKHSGSKREFNCSFCKATFGTMAVLKNHEKRHASDKPHKCEKCAMSFIWAFQLKRHQKTHMKNDKLKETEENLNTC